MTFPKGMDANAYALKVQPAAKSLGLLIRKAQWLGQGHAPPRTACEPLLDASVPTMATSEAPAPLAAAAVAGEAMLEPLPARVLPPAPAPEVPAQVSEREVVLGFGEGKDARRWRVRGLPKNLAVGVLKVNLMVSDEAGCFHVDSLDLYAARARAVFLQQAAAELGAPETLLKSDLGRVLLKLEALQDEAIGAALAPQEALAPTMTDAEREAALALLESPQLVARILADFEACGIVGERTNTLTAYLAATSRLLDAPLAIVVQSASAAGKTHLFRVACATHMLENGADIRYIQSLLGHAKLDTTQIYTQVSLAKLKEVHNATHPARLHRAGGPQNGLPHAPIVPTTSRTSDDASALLEALQAEARDADDGGSVTP